MLPRSGHTAGNHASIVLLGERACIVRQARGGIEDGCFDALVSVVSSHADVLGMERKCLIRVTIRASIWILFIYYGML